MQQPPHQSYRKSKKRIAALTLTVCPAGSLELAASKMLSTVVEVTLLARRSTPSGLTPSSIFGAAGGQLQVVFVAGVVQFFTVCCAASTVLYTIVGVTGLRRETAAIKATTRTIDTSILQQILPPRPFTTAVPLFFRSLTIVLVLTTAYVSSSSRLHVNLPT